ncbi:mannose-1-phosphate guanylyltransferase [Bacteroidia bacterium]|nr:mannose-1-phosphate guanylyltransferase [Bacteroidia bacterium]
MENSYCVIMSGGIGSRFWPFSRENKPKQFLDFLGTGRSLLQHTYDRFAKIVPKENIYIATNEQYAALTKEQLPDLKDNQLLLEPTRRNTAPCIAYAAYHIQAINPKASIVVTPADHLILQEHHFLNNIQTALEFAQENDALLTLGVTPNRPETGYGYIQTQSNGQAIHRVKAFTEKPNAELAKVFFESGEFYWNSGIFIWNVQTIIDAFLLYLPDMFACFEQGKGKYNTLEEKAFIRENYPKCQNISIDYGIMEKAANAYMLIADFGWSDLGSWGALYDLAEKDENRNAVLKCQSLFIESSDNLVTLSDGKLAVIQGLSDYVVVGEDNVLMICKKSEEQRIKQFLADVNMKYGDKFL